LRIKGGHAAIVPGDWEAMPGRENCMPTEDAKADLIHSPATGIWTGNGSVDDDGN
jgi:hypothetical protein